MWLNDAIALAVQRNASVPIGFQLIDRQTNSAIDITDCTITLAVAMAAGIDPFLIIDAVIDAPTQGGFTVTIDGADFDGIGGKQDIVVLAYDVRLTDQDGVQVIVMRGLLDLEPGVNP